MSRDIVAKLLPSITAV